MRVGGSSDDPRLTGSFNVAEKITLRSAASFQFANLSTTPSEVFPDEPVTIRFDVTNNGDTTGKPRIHVDGEPFPGEVSAVGPGESITVQIQSLDLVSNHTKAGIMIRNTIDDAEKPGGYLIHGINGYYGGVGNMEWDQDEDGYLESHAVLDPGGYPKWLTLEKDGPRFRCFYSSDLGQTWKLQRTLTLSSAAEAQDVGLFAASDTEDKPALVRFSDFAVKDGLFTGTIVREKAQEPKKQPEQPF